MQTTLFVKLYLLMKLLVYIKNSDCGQAVNQYYWSMDDPLFDCVTPIGTSSSRINLGVFIRPDIIVTSAIPLSYYLSYPQLLKVYVPNGTYSSSIECTVRNSAGDLSGKQSYPLHWGGNRTEHNPLHWGGNRTEHNPLHDLMFLYLIERSDGRNETIKVYETPSTQTRRPYYVPVAEEYGVEEPSGWRSGAFALSDRFHVNDSSIFAPLYYDDPVLVDCDEYFPRYWGYFICILNVDNYPAIQSGAPLIQNGRVFGVASFAMRRGRESIYAFTDLRPYKGIIDSLPAKFYG